MSKSVIFVVLLCSCCTFFGCAAPAADADSNGGASDGGGGAGSADTGGGLCDGAGECPPPGQNDDPCTIDPDLLARVIGDPNDACPIETCTEDASDSIVVDVTLTDRFDVPATCMNLAEFQVRQDAMITVTNTHPTRTVKIAAVNYEESDKQDLPRGACSEENLLPGVSVEECLASTVGGCENALSGPTTGFSAFLLPGETSLAVPYICSNEFTFPTTGACGEREIETRTTNWIIQAVFCNNNESAQTNFCSVVNPVMLELGQAANTQQWAPVESTGCD